MKKMITVFSMVLMSAIMSSTAKAVSLDEVRTARNLLYKRVQLNSQEASALQVIIVTAWKMESEVLKFGPNHFERAGNYPYLKQAEQLSNQVSEKYNEIEMERALGNSVDESALLALLKNANSRVKQLEDAYIQAVLLDIKAKRF